MCDYLLQNKERCHGTDIENSKFCILHIGFPDEQLSDEFQILNDLKKREFNKKLASEDFNFEGAKLNDVIFPKSCIIHTLVNFSNAHIFGSINGESVIIDGDAGFEGVIIEKNAVFNGVTIKGNALFDRAIIGGVLTFNGATVDETVWFNGAKIGGDAQFGGATFGKDARFGGVVIGGDARFSGVTIGRDASFYEAIIQGNAWFDGVKINGFLRFLKAKIGGFAWFNGVIIGSDARFGGVTVGGDIRFDKAVIGGSILFDKAKIEGTVLLDDATIDGDAKFIDCEKIFNISFISAGIKRNLDFSGSVIIGDTFSNYSKIFGNFIIDSASFSKASAREEVYRKAKKICEEVGDKIGADEYYFKEMVAKRQKKTTKKGLKIKILNFFEWLFFEEIFGYGVKPRNIIFSWAIIVLSFSFIFWYFHLIEASNPFDYFYFSLVNAMAPGYGAIIANVGIPRYVASTEAIFGIFLWACFITTFVRRFIR